MINMMISKTNTEITELLLKAELTADELHELNVSFINKLLSTGTENNIRIIIEHIIP